MSGRCTPSQTVGPFFSIGFSWLDRTDLTVGAEGGERVTIQGSVLDGEGQSVPDAVLEIWQADGHGRYARECDNIEVQSTNTFFGFGRVPVNELGEFRFTTIRPGCVSDAEGGSQAPHLVVSIFMRGLLRRLTTRIYFAGEAANNDDVVLNLVPSDRRHTLMAQPSTEEEKIFVWDVHLQGDRETVFFDC